MKIILGMFRYVLGYFFDESGSPMYTSLSRGHQVDGVPRAIHNTRAVLIRREMGQPVFRVLGVGNWILEMFFVVESKAY